MQYFGGKAKIAKEVVQVLTGKPQYKYVNLKNDKGRKLLRVHRLLAEAYIPKLSG